eukprot:1478628-Pyramimonas_sp.AAC.1
MLEIPFLWPDCVHDRVRRGQWEIVFSHATDVRKLYALLNAVACLLSRERWGMRVRTDRKAKRRSLAEDVHACRET